MPSEAESSGVERPVTEISGDDVILHIGCSQQWVSWARGAATQTSPGEAIQADVFLKESDGWEVVSAAAATIEDQLDGGEPTRLLDHAPFSYRVGFSEERARELLQDLETALEIGADAHKIELRLSHDTLQSIVEQFDDGLRADGSGEDADGAERRNPAAYPWPRDRKARIVAGQFEDIEFEFGRVVHIPVGRDGVVA